MLREYCITTYVHTYHFNEDYVPRYEASISFASDINFKKRYEVLEQHNKLYRVPAALSQRPHVLRIRIQVGLARNIQKQLVQLSRVNSTMLISLQIHDFNPGKYKYDKNRWNKITNII